MRAFPLGAVFALLLAGPAFAQRAVNLPARPSVPPVVPFMPPVNPRFVPGPNPYPAIYPTAQAFASSAFFYGGYVDEYYRRYPPVVYVVNVEPPPPPPIDPAQDPSRAKITLRVPLTSEVFVDGSKLQQNGVMREIITPPLEPGGRYHYDVLVRWLSKDKVVEQRMDVPFAAGERPAVMVLRPLDGK